MRKRAAENAGFTLIELMIVVMIIAILAAVGIPLMVRLRMNANESSAAASIRMVGQGQESFRTAAFVDADGNGQGDYASLVQLGNPDGGNQSEPFVDSVLASGIKSGYRFVSLPSLGGPGVAPGFQAFAIPTSPGQSGFQQLFVDETQVIRQTNDGSAVGPASPPLD